MDQIEIVKYCNRKYYYNSRYYSLAELSAMIKSGKDIRFVDYDTKKNITADTLLDIVMNNDRTAKHKASIKTLKTVIKSNLSLSEYAASVA